jgi:hypothetical protein
LKPTFSDAGYLLGWSPLTEAVMFHQEKFEEALKVRG